LDIDERFYIEESFEHQSVRRIAADLGRPVSMVRDYVEWLRDHVEWLKAPEGPIHQQVSITWRGRKAEVDVELADLILTLWKGGISTLWSCQEETPGIAWIVFATAADATQFLDFIAGYPDDENVPVKKSLYDRIAGYGWKGDWQYDVRPVNRRPVHRSIERDNDDDKLVEICTGPAGFDFHVAIRFPRTDLPFVLSQLRQGIRTRYEEMLECGSVERLTEDEKAGYLDVIAKETSTTSTPTPSIRVTESAPQELPEQR
jgi:hypothetical protein